MSVGVQHLSGAEDGLPQPVDGSLGETILGPHNVPLERENPSLLASPQTDNGTIPNLKFSFAAARTRLLTGGWAREVTARELPVATTLTGVNMRLNTGGIRELHWHKEAEWAFTSAAAMVVAGPLRPEQRRRAATPPRDVPQRPLRRRLACPVYGPDAAGARAGAPEPGCAHDDRRG